jgi:hypothetical protein
MRRHDPDLYGRYDRQYDRLYGRLPAYAPSASALQPTRKNVAFTHSLASASSTMGVVPAAGPSSKVEHDLMMASAKLRG